MKITSQKKVFIALGIVAVLGLFYMPTIRRQMNGQIERLAAADAKKLISRGCMEIGQVETPATGVRLDPIGPGPFTGSIEKSVARRFKCADGSIHDLPIPTQ